MPIEGLTNRRRLPRAGVIRLGIKAKKDGKEYPKETDYFVCPPEVQAKYGKEPKRMVIMFPVEDDLMFFPQFYKRYGNSVLLCKGDGITAHGWNFKTGGLEELKCPCSKLEEGGCKQIAILQFMLPEVEESAGVYQIATSSKNSIVDINSGIDIVRGIAGRVAMIPLILKRDEIKTHRVEGTEIKTGKHWTMKISLAMPLVKIQQLAQRPPSMALLPPAIDETVPEDLYPEDGFDSEPNETTVTVEPEAVEQDVPLDEDFISDNASPSQEASTAKTKDLAGIIKAEAESRTVDYKSFKAWLFVLQDTWMVPDGSGGKRPLVLVGKKFSNLSMEEGRVEDLEYFIKLFGTKKDPFEAFIDSMSKEE